MSMDLKKGRPKKDMSAEKVVVAVKASKEIPKTALIWALTHVVQPGDFITLLVVISSHSPGRKLWNFPRFSGDCATAHRRSQPCNSSEYKYEITDSCAQMILQLHDVYDPNKINVKIKVVPSTPLGAVAAEAKKSQANWVVLDKHLKDEEKCCVEELHCNIVVMKRSQPKVLLLNLNGGSSPTERKNVEKNSLLVTPSSSPEDFTATEMGTSSLSSSDHSASHFFPVELKNAPKNEVQSPSRKAQNPEESTSDSDIENPSASTSLRFSDFSGNLRRVISLAKTGPPPLCSKCNHKSPAFGEPPKWFAYAELSVATERFSRDNFLAEGGYGSVHRGVLTDGRVVAVKQHKLASSQGDREFCAEVEVLSCAQHRNVVNLIGFCVEDCRRLLVYEFICNGSLDSHLYGQHRGVLPWPARQKIAVGAARGLRYLHEECRVGCIVHRDVRPNNILVTHDFEPLVGDFGLARWQPDGESGVETRVIGTFGYLAPEYAQSGQITDKADVYSFGVVLIELVTGRKAVDLSRPKGQQCLTEWAGPLLESLAIGELVDPRLGKNYSEREVCYMLEAASMCVQREPEARPRMSQVLRILEGDMAKSSSVLLSPRFDAGNRSGRLQPLDHHRHRFEHEKGENGSRRVSSTNLSVEIKK